MSEADDLEILHPQRDLTIAGCALSVRELTFSQSLALHARMRPVLDLLQAPYNLGASIDSEAVISALAAHPEVACELLACSTNQPPEWIAALPEHDGYLLLLTFVILHVPFFAARLEVTRQLRAAANLSASPSSSPASSVTGTPLTH